MTPTKFAGYYVTENGEVMDSPSAPQGSKKIKGVIRVLTYHLKRMGEPPQRLSIH